VIAERGTRHDDTDDDDNDDVSHVGEVWLDGERGGDIPIPVRCKAQGLNTGRETGLEYKPGL